ncbi:MAG: hypothetical protein WCP69_09770 [Bacteroidota bacterium]
MKTLNDILWGLYIVIMGLFVSILFILFFIPIRLSNFFFEKELTELGSSETAYL